VILILQDAFNPKEFLTVAHHAVSAEDTFEQDVLLVETEPMIRKLAEHTWTASRKESRIARTVVLKLKTSESRFSLGATPQILRLLPARN
jgi:impB/mucB/samB family C-terminal domain